MSRQVTTNVLEAAYSQDTGEVLLHLLTITSADLLAPIRLVDNTVAITSRGDVYQPAPFVIALPADLAGELKNVTLQVDSVNREIINAIRVTREKISILMEIIAASDPDTVQASGDFDVLGSSYDASTAQLTLGFEPILFEPFPAVRFTPINAPGLY